jgi:isopropylmalate/homocitrate/citramalate synthase
LPPLPARVTVVEVGPRDGLQNEPVQVPTAVKLELIHRLAACGLPVVESGAFVSPQWVPRMADTAAIYAALVRRPGVRYPALVPNERGLDLALAAGVREIAVFAAASETFSRRNINCTIAESLARFRPVCARALAAGLGVRGYVSCCLGCPYEGEVAPKAVAGIARALVDLGCYEVSLGDTIGVGTPGRLAALLTAVARVVPLAQLAVHLHDTHGQALANLHTALQLGIATVDSAVAGLGGCPYAPGAAGNVATEDVVYLLQGLGVECGVDFAALCATGAFISQALGRPYGSRAGAAFLARQAATAAG